MTLVLGLGNELLADDGIGFHCARRIAGLNLPDVQVETTALHGLALLEYFLPFEQAIILDAIQTGHHPPGEILEFGIDSLASTRYPSPHYTGLPEMIDIARQLNLSFPIHITIIAMEVTDMATIGGTMTKPVAAGLDSMAEAACRYLRH